MKHLLAFVCVLAGACGDDGDIDSNEEARRAYLGLDESIGKSITLGFAGFNAASSANIDPQTTAGTAAGELTVTGQVDQGSSANKGMRLRIGMVDYTDGLVRIEGDEVVELSITYDTATDISAQPYLQMQLKDIPTGTLAGTLMGTYFMDGDLAGEVTLDVTFSGRLMDAGGGDVQRVPGSTIVTGTATNPDGGSYEIDLTL